jgi:hypothetical protein
MQIVIISDFNVSIILVQEVFFVILANDYVLPSIEMLWTVYPFYQRQVLGSYHMPRVV